MFVGSQRIINKLQPPPRCCRYSHTQCASAQTTMAFKLRSNKKSKVEVHHLAAFEDEAEDLSDAQAAAAKAQQWKEEGIMFAEDKNFDRALNCLEVAVQLNQSDAALYELRAQPSLALSSFEKVLELEAGHADALEELNSVRMLAIMQRQLHPDGGVRASVQQTGLGDAGT